MNKQFARLCHFGRRVSVGLTGVALSGLAMAQAADPFTATLTDASAKVTTYATGLVTVAAVGVLFMIAKKYVKKIPGAS